MLELALHVLDLCENALRAGATHIAITITEDTAADTLTLDIADNGSGMSAEQRDRARDPFFTTRTEHRIGMGLPLLEQAAVAAGGGIRIAATESGGTRVTATFGLSHPDRQPLGDIAGTVAMLLAGHPGLDVLLVLSRSGEQRVIDTRRMRVELDGLWVEHPAVLQFIRDRIRAALAAPGADT